MLRFLMPKQCAALNALQRKVHIKLSNIYLPLQVLLLLLLLLLYLYIPCVFLHTSKCNFNQCLNSI